MDIFISQFLNFQSFAKPVVNQSTGKLEDTAMEDLPVRSVENVPDKVEVIVNYQDFPIFSSNFKILEILKFFHQFIKENHQFIKFIKFHKIFFLELVPKKE